MEIATGNSHAGNSHEIATRNKIATPFLDASRRLRTAKKIATKIATPPIFLATVVLYETSEKNTAIFRKLSYFEL